MYISFLDLAVDEEDERSQHSAPSDDSSTSDSNSDSDSSSDSSGSDGRGRINQEYLDSLLERAMKNAEALETQNGSREEDEDTDEEIILTNDTLPCVNPLSLRDMFIFENRSLDLFLDSIQEHYQLPTSC